MRPLDTVLEQTGIAQGVVKPVVVKPAVVKMTILLLLLVSVVAAGCSRLTFVRPKYKSDFTQTAPEYKLRADPEGAKRIAAIDHVALAEQRLRAGDLDQAESQAKAALKADPASVDAYTLLAVTAEQRGQSAQAGALYAKAAEMAPQNGSTLNNYGTWLCRNARAGESLAYFDGALTSPGYGTPASALANAGSCALGAGQAVRAERDLARSIQLDPTNPVALAALARSAYSAGRYMDARAYSERRLAAAPAAPDVLLLASQIEQKLGDNAAAARYVQRMRTEFPQARAAASPETGQ